MGQQAMDGSPAVVEIHYSRKFAVTNPNAPQLVPPSEPYARIKFQCGPIAEVGINGCSIEDVIDVLAPRLEGFQRGSFRCRENALAITKLEEAKHWLLERTRKRQEQGVEGYNLAHKDGNG